MRTTNFILAEKAAAYSRSLIKKGSTQISNNKLSDERYDALYDAVKDNRDLVREYKLSSNNIDFTNPLVSVYEKAIYVSAKSSLGNCFEMTLQAFDYLLYHPAAADLNFEIFEVAEMDHEVGEKPKSEHILMVIGGSRNNSLNPKDWKGDIWICDPWNENKQVYSLSEIPKYLKTWLRKSDSSKTKNLTVNYNAKTHVFKTGYGLNISSFQLRELRKQQLEELKNNFINEARSILSTHYKMRYKLKFCYDYTHNAAIPSYLEKIEPMKQQLEQLAKEVIIGTGPFELRELHQKINDCLVIVDQLLYPTLEICELMETIARVLSAPSKGGFFESSTKVTNSKTELSGSLTK